MLEMEYWNNERWNIGFEGKNNLKIKYPIILLVFQYSFIPSALGFG